MRQAGRALPEYQEVRKTHTLLEICADPELCARVTLQPVESLEVDGAIIFADIMTPLIGLGLPIDIVDGVGPVIEDPIRDRQGVKRLRPLDAGADVPELLESLRLARGRLDALGRSRALLGFSGAPFTLASYLIEGRASRDFTRTKRMMLSSPDLWDDFMRRLAEIVTSYLLAQVKAGADAVQLFDSWAGALSPDEYSRFVQPHSARVLSALSDTGTPVIHFAAGTAGFLDLIRDAGGTTVGVDWRVRLDAAWKIIGGDKGIQGNLDPAALLGPLPELKRAAHAVLARAAGRPGHIFNLGHGVHPDTPVENLRALVTFVQEYRAS